MISTLKFITRHPLTVDNPLAALWRYGKWQLESRLRSEVIVDWVDGSKLVVRNGMTGATGNIYCGLHEFTDMAFVLHFLRPGDLFIDIGANVGSYTVLASKVCGARSIAVEPDPGTMHALRRNIAVNRIGGLVRTEELALGAAQGTAPFTVGRDTVNQISYDHSDQVRKVRLERLDALLAGESPILIKMDVEGFEAEVLEGAKEILHRQSLVAVETENSGPKVTETLECAGFSRWFYDPVARDLSQTPCRYAANNALFIRDIDVCRERVSTSAGRNIFGRKV